MKRATLADRVDLLIEKQHQLEDAARALSKAEEAGGSIHGRSGARRELQRRALDFGVVCIRYIGGKTK